ncbi:MAG: hypothetical protein ACYCOO_11220 [Chitinophagaceae bacterium]
MNKFLLLLISVLVVTLFTFCYLRFYYPYGEGNKSGLLIQFLRKGYVFKTYEGQLIQADQPGYSHSTLGSQPFSFSVQGSGLADSLMLLGGKLVVLHYEQYFGSLPWRGQSKNIVDKIVFVQNHP